MLIKAAESCINTSVQIHEVNYLNKTIKNGRGEARTNICQYNISFIQHYLPHLFTVSTGKYLGQEH